LVLAARLYERRGGDPSMAAIRFPGTRSSSSANAPIAAMGRSYSGAPLVPLALENQKFHKIKY